MEILPIVHLCKCVNSLIKKDHMFMILLSLLLYTFFHLWVCLKGSGCKYIVKHIYSRDLSNQQNQSVGKIFQGPTCNSMVGPVSKTWTMDIVESISQNFVFLITCTCACTSWYMFIGETSDCTSFLSPSQVSDLILRHSHEWIINDFVLVLLF